MWILLSDWDGEQWGQYTSFYLGPYSKPSHVISHIPLWASGNGGEWVTGTLRSLPVPLCFLVSA